MNLSEYKEVSKNIKNPLSKYFWVYLITSFLIGVISTIGIEFLKTKGQNLATKQDIADITKKIEEVKAKMQNNQEIIKQKRDLKFKALYSSLTIIDAYISQRYLPKNKQRIDKQKSSTDEVRACHNNLILTCDSMKIIDLFVKILLPSSSIEGMNDPIELLNTYRNLVRKELEFGEELKLDTTYSWFGSTLFTKR